MSKRITLGLMAILMPLAWNWPAMANEEPPQEEQNQTSTLASIDRYVCTLERRPDSRIRRRVCRTESQIDEDREEGREFLERAIAMEAQRPRAN